MKTSPVTGALMLAATFLLTSCASPAEIPAAPSATSSSPSESVDWASLNAEEINDPAPLSNSALGYLGFEELELEKKQVSYLLQSFTQVPTVELFSAETGKPEGTYGPSSGSKLYKAEITLFNHATGKPANGFAHPKLWSNPTGYTICVESKENILLGCMKDWSSRAGGYWDAAQVVEAGDNLGANFYFDVPGKPAYLTFVDKTESARIGGKIDTTGLSYRMRLAG